MKSVSGIQRLTIGMRRNRSRALSFPWVRRRQDSQEEKCKTSACTQPSSVLALLIKVNVHDMYSF